MKSFTLDFCILHASEPPRQVCGLRGAKGSHRFLDFSDEMATYLIHLTHQDLSPAFYSMGIALISGAVILTMPETYKAELT